MTKKRRNLRILASIIAAGCVWATGMGNVFAYDTANHGNSYEAKVVLSATKETDGNTGLGIALYRGDRKNEKDKIYQNPDVQYMTDDEAKAVLGNLYNATYAYTVVESSATAEFNKILTTTVINDVRAMVENGQNVYITGDGTDTNPYVINAVDTYANEVKHTIVDGELKTTVIHNNQKQVVSNSVKIGGATINYAGDTGTENTSTIEQAINNNYTNITNNTTEINEIKNDYVTNIHKDENNEDVWYVTQNVEGTPQTVEFKDKHITGHSMTLNGDKIVSSITTNFGNPYNNEIRIGDATINYAGDIVVNNQDGTTTQVDETIENAINNNYNKIVNVENNYVSNIVQKDEHTWKVIQGGQETVTIKDTTLVEKNLFGKDANGNKVRAIDIIVPRVLVQDADGNYDASQVAAYQSYVEANGLIGYIDQATGVPEIVMEFEDTSGNVVQGAVDFGTLFAESLQTEAGANIVVTQKARGLGNYEIALASDVNTNSVTADTITANNELSVANRTVVINARGIQINNQKITGVADGEISANSTEAINGSQLWETNRNMDKLGGRLDKVGAGAAALAALHPLDFDPDDKLQFSAGVGNYKGETAAALGAFYRPTEKVMFSVAGTMGNGENMVNAGVTFALDRKNNVSNSRVAMAHEIQDLRDQVAALTALVSQIAGKGNPLLDTVMFPDVPENHWAYDYVESLQKRGIIEGYPDGNFGGDRSCTRYEYAAMLYRALEKGFPVDSRLLDEFKAELGRIRIDRIKGADDDANKVERVRVNDYEDRDDYGSKLAQVVADAAPAIEEEPAA